jgi:hypothetical protein
MRIVFRRFIASIQALSALFGFIGVFSIGTSYGLGYHLAGLGLFLLPVPLFSIFASYLLWRDKVSGYFLSFFLNFLALVDIKIDTLSFSYSNGFVLNLDFEVFLIDLWSLFLLVCLFTLTAIKVLTWDEAKTGGAKTGHSLG